MVFSGSHLITYFLLFLIPHAASVTFYFQSISPQNQNVDIVTEGDGAYISDSGIQVTPDGIGSDRSQKAGRATYVTPLHLWDNRSNELASFSTNFTFVIDSNGATTYADGLTFFLAENNSLISRGGCMGLPINFTTFKATNAFVAVEFDTYHNSWDPVDAYNASIGDHVGISITSLTSLGYQQWFSNISEGLLCEAWISYDNVSQTLSISHTDFQGTTGMQYMVDLRTVLPEWVIFGFSAATGDWFEKNNVKSWGLSNFFHII